jgi:hypothetical protein
MTVTPTPEQQQWLEAVRMAVADFRALQTGNLLWARPYVDQARHSAARGEVVSGEEFLKSLDSRLQALRSP